MGRAAGMINLLARPVNEINPRAIEAELAAHPSGMKALLSTMRPKELQMAFNPEVGAAILKALRGMAKHVAVDLGVGLTRENVRLLKEVDQVVVVVEPNRVTLMMAREILRELETIGLGRGRANVVIVNRAQSQFQIPWQEAEQILSHETLALVAPAPDLAFQAAEAGTPMVLFQPASIVATQMTKLAEELGTRVRTLANSGS